MACGGLHRSPAPHGHGKLVHVELATTTVAATRLHSLRTTTDRLANHSSPPAGSTAAVPSQMPLACLHLAASGTASTLQSVLCCGSVAILSSTAAIIGLSIRLPPMLAPINCSHQMVELERRGQVMMLMFVAE